MCLVILFRDGIHFTCEANKVVIKEIVKMVKGANWEPSLYYRLLPAEFNEDSPYDPVSADGTSTSNVSDYSSDRLLFWGINIDD